jgi:hypothetical protein
MSDFKKTDPILLKEKLSAEQFAVTQQHDNCLRKGTRIVGQHNVTAVVHFESFRSDGGRDDRL